MAEKTSVVKKHLRPKARLFTILGQQLISNEVIAVIELVKNSYDADASKVSIRLDNIRDKQEGKIEIVDDGTGMDGDTLARAWLEPATNFKTLSGKKELSPRFKRLPLGEKGVGRFATDKLGEQLEVVTRKSNNETESLLKLQSEWFEADKYLDEIDAEIISRTPAEIIQPPHGTIIRIGALRAVWKEKMVERLHFGLGRLLSPFADIGNFEIQLDCPDFPLLSGKITNPIYAKAPYKVKGRIDENGKIGFYYNEDDLRYDSLVEANPYFEVKENGRGSSKRGGDYRKPECGPFKVQFYVWDLDIAGLKRAEMDKVAKDLLKQTSGVSIYRNGFRIMPYGEMGDDWLDLNQRRVNNPTLNLSKNQIIGFVEITQEENPKLQDKTNREGLIEEGDAFSDLRALTVAALSLVEVRRYSSRTAARKKRTIAEDIVIHRINEGRAHFTGSAAQHVFDAIQNAYLEKKKEFETNRELLIQLAGIGLTAERLTHEFQRTTISLQKEVRDIKNELRASKYEGPLTQMTEAAASHIEVLQSILATMEPLYYTQRKKTQPLNIRAVVEDVVRLFKRGIDEASIQVSIKAEAEIVVQMNRGHLLQLFSNLLDNSIYWLSTRKIDEPRILVVIGREKDTVLFSDNGPGIQDEYKDLVFEPFFTTKADGRGLGLYIVRDILLSYKWDVTVEPKSKLLPGATFKLRFNQSTNTSNA
jgi:hypothetical protein